jgi:hypothetical protein
MQTHMRPLIQRLVRSGDHKLKYLQNVRTLTEGDPNISHKYSPNDVATAWRNINTPKL